MNRKTINFLENTTCAGFNVAGEHHFKKWRNMQGELTDHELRDLGVYLIRLAVNHILNASVHDPKNAFITERSPEGKEHTRLDLSTEGLIREHLRTYRNGRFKHIDAYSEETLPTGQIPRTSLVCLMDLVDGTDLVVRGLHNWCAALVFLAPNALPGHRIKAAVVGLSSKEIYYSTDSNDGAFVLRSGNEPAEAVAGPSSVVSVNEASICFYGQRLPNLVSAAQFFEMLGGSPNDLARIYNLAGMPMMMKLIDHRVKMASGIDVVFDCHGQKPHDTVAGLFIAMKAEATVRDLDASEPRMSYITLENAVQDCSTVKLRYVVASTEPLCNAVVDMLNS